MEIISSEKIERVNQLLGRYYSGTASTDEIEALSGFFNSVDRSLLPDSLREEATFFDAMHDSRMSEIMATMPDDLEERVRSVTIGHQPRMIVWRRVARSVAAVAVIAIAAGIWLLNPTVTDNNDEVMPTIYVALAQIPDEEPDTHCEIATVVEKPAPKPVVRTKCAVAQVERVVTEDCPDNYIEVTDVMQAAILTQDALALVRSKLAVTKTSLSSASDGLRRIDETLRDLAMN